MNKPPTHQFRTLREAEYYLTTHAGLVRSRPQTPDRWLERMRTLCMLLGNPQESYRTIHVAGTSGKGSTTTLIAALLVAHGHRVGHTISPYVVSVRERIQVAGRPVAVATFLRALSRVAHVAVTLTQSPLRHPSSFELITAASFLIFAEAGVDYAVTETGMGGRFDATNVVVRPDKLAVVTRIGLDHQEYLGQTLERIASEKAAIIQPKADALVLAQRTGYVFANRALEVNARLRIINPRSAKRRATLSVQGTAFPYRINPLRRTDWQLGLIGQHQVENAILALETVRLLSERDQWHLNEQRVTRALRTVSLPARFELRQYQGKTVVIDGAHNSQKLAAFLAALKRVYPTTHPIFVVGFRQGKPVQSMLRALHAYGGNLLFTQFQLTNDLPIRSASAAELLRIWSHYRPAQSARAFVDPFAALAAAVVMPGELIVVTGSLYLAGAVLPALLGVRN